MLDTVRLVVYDIGDGLDGVPGRTGVHRPLIEHLKYMNTTRLVKTRLSVNSKSDVRVNKTYLNRDFLWFSATEKFVERAHSFVKHLPSSNYKVRYEVNYSDDCFSVEFSIPKYFFGTNVLQTTFHPNDTDFDPYNKQKSTLEYQYSLIYERFIRYIKAFFRNEFPSLHVDYTKVHLRRLDLCYNLVFSEAPQALVYLAAMRNVQKKRQREGTTASTDYDTAIFIRNADYSFKIYHKGTEYRKHDRVEHERANEAILKNNSMQPLGRLSPYGQNVPKVNYQDVFPVEDLQDLADRTLRFEITFHSSYISKIFNQIIRTDKHHRPVQESLSITVSRRFNNFRKYFNRITSILQNRVNWDEYRYNQNQLPLNQVVSFAFTLTSKDPFKCVNYVAFMEILDKLKEPLVRRVGKGIKYNSYYDLLYSFANLKEKNYQNDLKMLDVFYSRMSGYYSKHHKIALKLSDEDFTDFYDHYNSAEIAHIPVIRFTKDTMLEMVKRFLDSVYQFEVKELDDFDDFKNKVVTDKKMKANEALLLSAYKLCCLGVSLKEQAKMFGWGDSTLRRYQLRFKKLGVDRSHQANKVPPVEFSFSKYFESIAENKFFMNFNHMLR